MNTTATLNFFQEQVKPSNIAPQRNIAHPVMSHDDIVPLSIPLDYENASEIEDSNTPQVNEK